MLKVVLVLKEIALRLKESQAEVIIKKNREVIQLASGCKIYNGLSNPQATAEFYVSPNDSQLNIQVIFLEGMKRKLGGNTILRVNEWQPNVLHENISVLNNSPDRKARLHFNFYYFLDNSVADKRKIFLSSDRYKSQRSRLQQKNIKLLSQKKELEKELIEEASKNKQLIIKKEKKQLDFVQDQQKLKDRLDSCQKSIRTSRQRYEYSKQMRKELCRIGKEKGLFSGEEGEEAQKSQY